MSIDYDRWKFGLDEPWQTEPDEEEEMSPKTKDTCPTCGNTENEIVNGKDCGGFPNIVYRRCVACGKARVADLSHVRAPDEIKHPGRLVLSRKYGEAIVCTLPDGRLITLTVVQIRGDKVRIGIDAPEEVKVLRSELLEVTP